MTLLGLILGGVGIMDLVLPEGLRRNSRSVIGCLIPGVAAFAVLRLGDVAWQEVIGTVAAVSIASLSWAVIVTWCVRGDGRTWPALATGAAILGGALVLSPYSPTLSGRVDKWLAEAPLAALSGLSVDRLVLVVGCSLLLMNSGNVIVRLVLTAAGSSFTRNEQQIKGGRVLGPMERLLIFGLGLSGNLEAAAVIVAAKGLLRFPELQAYRAGSETAEALGMQRQRIDALTEYFLIGSMTSWLLALAVLVLL